VNLRNGLAALVALAVGAAVLLLWPKKAVSPEEEIRALVARCVAAAEKKDVSTIADALAEDFRSGAGTREEVKGYLLGVLMRNPAGVGVLNPTLEVTVQSPTTASMRGTFIFARAGAGSEMSRYDIEGTLEKRDGAWRFTSATWRQ
jgi:hypothetical protein